MIKIRNVSKSFNGKSVLKNITLDINPGERVAIIGPSGCGKSTILKLMLGLIRPDSGYIVVNGKHIESLTTDELMDACKSVGLLFQHGALFDSLTVKQNVAFYLTEQSCCQTEREVDKKVKEKLEMVGMSGTEDKMPAELSGGQQKRIGLARVLAKEPKIIFYDEPTTGLDPVLSTSIEDLIVKFSEDLGVTSIIVTHQISTILRTVDKIYYMHDGTLLDPETPKSILKTTQTVIKDFIKGAPRG